MQNTPSTKTKYADVIAAILIVIAIGAGCGLAGIGVYQLTSGTSVFSTAPSSGSNPNSNSANSTVNVSLPNGVGGTQGLNYSPANVTVAKGGKVIWTNNDPVPHTVTSTSVPSGASSFDSGNMNQGATFTVTFTVDGTYRYKCSYHPWMTGIVIVTG